MKKIPKKANWYKAKWHEKLRCYLGLHKFRHWEMMVLPGPPAGTRGMCNTCGLYWYIQKKKIKEL